MTDRTPPNSPDTQIAAIGYTLTDAEREVIARYERRLVCSWCGEDYEGDPEFSGSDCCSCDLVPASDLPSIIQSARQENEDLLAEWVKEDEAGV